jgi:hypothetical protein
VRINKLKALAANLDDGRIGFDFDAAQMNTAFGSDNVTCIAGGKSVVIDNDQPAILRTGKAFQNKGG